MQDNADQLVIIIGITIALSLTYGKWIGPLQTDISQAFIDAWQVPSQYKRLLNLAVGMVLAITLTVVAALALGDWGIVGIGALAGIMASVEASRVHDQEGAFQAGVETGIHEARQTLRRVPPGEGISRRSA